MGILHGELQAGPFKPVKIGGEYFTYYINNMSS